MKTVEELAAAAEVETRKANRALSELRLRMSEKNDPPITDPARWMTEAIQRIHEQKQKDERERVSLRLSELATEVEFWARNREPQELARALALRSHYSDRVVALGGDLGQLPHAYGLRILPALERRLAALRAPVTQERPAVAGDWWSRLVSWFRER